MAATTAVCQGIWLARLLAELRGSRPSVFKLKIDSQSALQLSKNPVFHDRSKHIDTRFHFIRDCIEEKRVDIDLVGTKHQLADILTKALGREQFCELRSRIGVVNVQSMRKA